jgi:hypothetical protein
MWLSFPMIRREGEEVVCKETPIEATIKEETEATTNKYFAGDDASQQKKALVFTIKSRRMKLNERREPNSKSAWMGPKLRQKTSQSRQNGR